MLNTDAKIYSKILANRLYRVLPLLTHLDQSGFMKGRYIGENLVDLTSAIEHCEINRLDTLLIGIDFKKAFDNICWDSYYDSLRFFGFGEKYIQYVKNLFPNISSYTINHGWSSPWIRLKKGFRQGCCYSPPAFILIIETLGLKIRQDEKIEGIKLGHIHKKHVQFADDLWAIIQAKQVVLDEFFTILENYSDFAGLKINYNKTQILRIGSLRNSDSKLITQGTISWSRRVKILGLSVSPNREEMCSSNYDLLIKKIQKIINSWKARGLSLLGKVQVINTLVSSQFIYYFTNTYAPTAEIMKKLKDIIVEYLWEGKPSKIAFEQLIQDYHNGGVKMVDLQAKHIALKTKWFKLIQGKSTISAMHAQNMLPLPVGILINCNINNKDFCKVIQNSPNKHSIWWDIWATWTQCYYVDKIEKTQIIHQVIWFNSKIKSNGEILYYKNYIAKGIYTIKHIFNQSERRFFTWDEILKKYNVKGTFLQYYGILEAISHQWKALICKNCTTVQIVYFNFESSNFTKSNYWRIIDKKQRIDTGLLYWSKKFLDLQMDEWQKRRLSTFKITPLTKLRYLQYRILSNKLSTNQSCSRWDPLINENYTFCLIESETVTHLLWECEHTQKLWQLLIRWMEYLMKTKLNITVRTVILNNYKGQYALAVNIIILMVKMYLYRKRCLCEKNINLRELLVEIQNYHQIEYIVAKKENHVSKYYKKWKWLL